MNWKDKALAATRGSQLGAIIACAIGREQPVPCFHGKARITSDGFVMCDFTRFNGEHKMGAFVGSLNDLIRNAVGLANHLNLDAEERVEFAERLSGWIATDYSGGAADRISTALKGKANA